MKYAFHPYFFIKHQKIILIFLAVISTFLGLVGFGIAEESTGLEIINDTIAMFAIEWGDSDNAWIDFAKFFAIITTTFGILSIFLSNIVNSWIVYKLQKNQYSLIIGLSEENQALLKSMDDNTPIIIIEANQQHAYLNYFKEQGFGVKVGMAENVIQELNLTNMNRCIISTGNGRVNISLVKQFYNLSDSTNKQTIYVRIDNRDLDVLFKQNVVYAERHKSNINVISYSLYENMAKIFCSQHNILGKQLDIINSNDDFSTVLIGSSSLATELIYHLTLLASLPNQNHFTIYCIDDEADKFYKKIQILFPGIDKIPHLTIKAKNLDSNSLTFYEDSVWKSQNLTNILIATDDEEKNLEIAINLQDTTFVKDIGHNEFKSKVVFALYYDMGLGEQIDQNKEAFANFFVFGNIAKSSTKEILFDEDLDFMAKLIHNDYSREKEVNKESLYNSWMNLSAHKKESNKAQALHLDTKLLAFGLCKVKSTIPFLELLKINKEIFDKYIPNKNEIEKNLKSYKSEYFPSSFESTLLNKVARAEHNRWNAFHYLNGWSYNAIRNDQAKEHNCLLPIEEFECENTKYTYQYDLASVYYIPIYLARGGYEILECK